MIKALKVDDGCVESPYEVRKAVVDHFTYHVSSTSWDRPKLDGVAFDTLSKEENGCLVAPLRCWKLKRWLGRVTGINVRGRMILIL